MDAQGNSSESYYVGDVTNGIVGQGREINISYTINNHPIVGSKMFAPTDDAPDVVILTVLPEEYKRMCSQIGTISHLSDIGTTPNQYAWRFGAVKCPRLNATYKVAVGMIGRPGSNQSALAVSEAIRLWRPRYVFFLGIAGGIPDPKKPMAGPKLGDVVIADAIYDYEYAKVNKIITSRGRMYKTDLGLLNGANAYGNNAEWRERIKIEPPIECMPEVIRGEIASGEKVVDDPTNDFFVQLTKNWSKVNAVEMEGAGVGSAIEQAQSLGISVGFMMIRGISDLPHPEEEDDVRVTEVRDSWKLYASDTAAAFTFGWISDGLPLPPSVQTTCLHKPYMDRIKYINIIKFNIEYCINVLEQDIVQLLPEDLMSSSNPGSSNRLDLFDIEEIRSVTTAYNLIRDFNERAREQRFVGFTWERLNREDGYRLPLHQVRQFMNSQKNLLSELNKLKNVRWLNQTS